MEQPIPGKQLKWLYFFIAMAVAVNFSGLFVTIMGPDAALFATIAKTMVLRHDYINMYMNGHDWLDKPHFPFWITAVFFNLFGFTTWAYKLPGILFLMMGALYTYYFAKDLYNNQIALWSVLILLTAQHILLSNNDVRAEPYLTGLIIASIYHFYKANINNNYMHLLAGCLFAACSIMTKGMFAIIPIGGAIVGQLIITKQWNKLFSRKWLLGIILTMLFIAPELYCLHQQFDIHPEKVVFGTTGVSGTRFFFWDSQFGRFFNTGPIKGGGDSFFFVHTTLWAFLPWSLLFFVSVYRFIKTGLKNVQGQEWYCVSASLLTFVLFSASKFQLPHYMNIVFPFFAIITAQYLYSLQFGKSVKTVRITQIAVIVIMLALVCAIQYFYIPVFGWPVTLMLAILYVALMILPRKATDGKIPRIVLSTVMASFLVNIYLNLAFYPSLLKYQAGSETAMWLNKNNIEKYPVFQCEDNAWPMEFYLNQPLYYMNPDTTKVVAGNTFLFYGNPDEVSAMTRRGWNMHEMHEADRYYITRLKPSFLNKDTRPKEIEKMRVMQVNPPVK